ncbi:Uncharacterised protein [Vibrio cholerae]|nr:Uncharacterised protein [Vibrio cholerae]
MVIPLPSKITLVRVVTTSGLLNILSAEMFSLPAYRVPL